MWGEGPEEAAPVEVGIQQKEGQLECQRGDEREGRTHGDAGRLDACYHEKEGVSSGAVFCRVEGENTCLAEERIRGGTAGRASAPGSCLHAGCVGALNGLSWKWQ